MHEMIPYIQVRSNSLIIYSLPAVTYPKRQHKLPKLTYTGKTTDGNRKRLRQAIDILLMTSPERQIFNTAINRWHKFRLGFVTLTIPDDTKVNAKDAHKYLLKPFLRTMQAQGKLSYIWKAELQKRGQLHYHITWNKFRHHSDIKNTWNNRLRKMGLSRQYAKNHGHFNPNSTDVHSVRKIRNFEAYLTKYMCKDPGGKINGKIWDCSKDLKRPRFSTELVNFNHQGIIEDIKNARCQRKVLDHCTVIKCSNPQKYLSFSQLQAFDAWK